MGYISTFTGRVDIIPSLTAAELRNSSLAMGANETGTVRVEVSEREVETDDGVLTQRSGVALVPSDWSTKGYDFGTDLMEVIGMFPSHRFSGEIVRTGEEQPDMERYVVDGTEVRTEKARMYWPDGTEVSQARR